TFTASDVIEIITPAEAAQPIAAPEIEPSAPHYGETEIQREECVSPDRANDDHISEPPTLPDAIGAAFDALPGRRVNKKTGELISWPRSTKRVLAWLAEQCPDMWPQWERAAPRQIERVRKLRRNAVFAEVRDLKSEDLDKALTGCSQRIVRYERRA